MDLGHGTAFFWQISTCVLWDLLGSQETHDLANGFPHDRLS